MPTLLQHLLCKPNGSAVILCNAINHYSVQPYVTVNIESSVIKLQAFPCPLMIVSICNPPCHSISTDEYQEYLTTLGPYFLVAGNRNAKHSAWGSRLITPKRRNLLQEIQRNNVNYLSTDETTDPLSPDGLDFASNQRDFSHVLTNRT